MLLQEMLGACFIPLPFRNITSVFTDLRIVGSFSTTNNRLLLKSSTVEPDLPSKCRPWSQLRASDLIFIRLGVRKERLRQNETEWGNERTEIMRTGILAVVVMAGTVMADGMMGAMDIQMGLLRSRAVTTTNFQTFSGALGGVAADPVCSVLPLLHSYFVFVPWRGPNSSCRPFDLTF